MGFSNRPEEKKTGFFCSSLVFFITLHPKMRIQRKRIASAWLLLSVFVSMMMLTALHHHQPSASAADCVECTHHVQHHSHLTAGAGHMHDCVLCQFLSLPYLPATAIAVVLFAVVTCIAPQHRFCFIAGNGGNAQSSRAPPAGCSAL